MKIISINFLNLNSLKGKHEINFDRPPFTESGLFAITGTTGAGKTTILDAITVALYGKVHRHNKDVFEIMTRHTGESYAEVEFEVKDKLYRAKWSLRRSRGKADGAFQAPKMELAEALSGEIIINHPLNEVREAIVNLCGLDYNQFLRSVMLSQGDFTRFLKADENERSELLEKITDTGIYSEISIAAFEKVRAERIKLEQLKSKLNDMALLTAEERLAYTEELAELLTKEAVIRNEDSALRMKLDWLNSLEKLEKRREELQEQLKGDELFYNSHLADFERLKKHQQALVYRPALAELKTIELQVQKIETDLRELELLLPAYLKEESETKVALTLAKDQNTLAQQTLTEQEPVFETVIKKDILIEQAKSNFEKTGKEVAQANTGLTVAVNAGISLSTELKHIQERITLLSGWLQDHAEDAKLDKEIIVFNQYLQQTKALDFKISSVFAKQHQYKKEVEEGNDSILQTLKTITRQEQKLLEQQEAVVNFNVQLQTILAGKTTEELEQELTGFPPLISTSEQQIRLATLYFKQQEELGGLTKELEKHRHTLQFTQDTIKELNQQHEQATAILAGLQQIHELEVKFQNYDEARLTLVPEEPCPLCGSLHHPYAENNYSGKVNESAERRNQQQEKVQQLKAQLNEQQLQLNTLTYQVNTGVKNQAQLELDIADTLKEFESNNLQLPKPLAINKPGIITAVIEKKKLQQEALQQQLKSARDLQIQLNTLESTGHQQKEALTGLRNQSEQVKLSIAFAEKQLKEIGQELIIAENEKQQIVQSCAALLTPFKLMYVPSATKSVLQEMNDRFNRYSSSAQELTKLQPELRQKETEIKNITATTSEKEEKVRHLTVQLQEENRKLELLKEERFVLFGTKDPQQEREQLNITIKKYRSQVDTLQISMQEKQEQMRIAEARKGMLTTDSLAAKARLALQQIQLLNSIMNIGLSSIVELNQLYLPEDRAAELEKIQQEAAQKIASDKSMSLAVEKELGEEKAKSLTEEQKDVLVLQLQDQDAKLSELREQKGKVGQVLSKDDQLKMQHQEVAQQIESQQKEFDRFQKLSSLIGSADGKRFSRFAQGLTLARLTELANRHLLRLSDRYSILKSPEKDLDLQIIDGYQADVIRPMTTLSGGESFLVSLALALGLSDLASRKVQINSLFIDEGFGTLDAETLDVAITALENLQANGKSIGIISHVEALKERIGTQIQVTKLPGGSSKITLHSYGNLIQI